MSTVVTVAVPVRDGGRLLDEVLAAVRSQRVEGAELELVVCDSGSRDGSVAVARAHGAEVVEIAPTEFGHGRTRNLLMQRSHGARVAFLTQDATPAGDRWLARLLEAFELAPDVALAFGPYVPRETASPFVARELRDWFAFLAPDGRARVDRLTAAERAGSLSPRDLLGARGYFTDANGCLLRAAWEEVPFREVPYAEDHALAHDMLRAGYAKAYVPGAAVIHSHDYTLGGWLRRSFDEARAVREIYGYAEPLGLRRNARKLRGAVAADWRASRSARLVPASAIHHGVRLAGALLGGRAGLLPRRSVETLAPERAER
jgi:rhamnosyltransferase